MKKNPGLAYATSGAGNPQHYVGEWFANVAGISLTHVPYKGGGQAITDFVGGQVKVAVLGSTPLIPHARAGKVKLLAQSLHTRARHKDVPTFEEAGYKVVLDQWQGVMVPAKTPAAMSSAPQCRDRQGARRSRGAGALWHHRPRAHRQHARGIRACARTTTLSGASRASSTSRSNDPGLLEYPSDGC